MVKVDEAKNNYLLRLKATYDTAVAECPASSSNVANSVNYEFCDDDIKSEVYCADCKELARREDVTFTACEPPCYFHTECIEKIKDQGDPNCPSCQKTPLLLRRYQPRLFEDNSFYEALPAVLCRKGKQEHTDLLLKILE